MEIKDRPGIMNTIDLWGAILSLVVAIYTIYVLKFKD